MQVALPGPGQSFAWMYSIENPSGQGNLPGVGAQVRFRLLPAGLLCAQDEGSVASNPENAKLSR